MKKWRLNPTSFIWILVHVVVILAGALMWIYGDTPSQQSYKALWQAIGGSLIATGAAGEALFLYVLTSDSTRSRLDLIMSAGIEKIFPVRSIQIKNEYDDLLNSAKEIDIIGFGLSSLREDYAHEFAIWSRKAKVRIIVLDPDYPSPDASYADQRDREEKNHAGKIRQDVIALLASIEAAENLVADRFQVRVLRSLPSINMFRIDDHVFWGPYFALQQSRNTPTLLVKGGFLFDKLREHFESLWASDELTAAALPRARP